MGHGVFRFGDWQVDPRTNTVSGKAGETQLEPRAMDVLGFLCARQGEVVSVEELLLGCWGSAENGDNPVHKAIAQLRRALGDDSSAPRYIETIRKRGYRAIAAVVDASPGAPGSWQAGSPFRGLSAFEEGHAAIFFGRAQATARLFDATIAQLDAGCAMVMLLGPSGSGKTSLVRAGLLPQLMVEYAQPGARLALGCTLYLDCADLGGGGLFQALAAVLIDAELDGSPLLAGDSAASLGERLAKDPAGVCLQLMAQGKRARIGLFVDRLEAMFRLNDANDALRARFVAVLEQLARSGTVFVVLACRNDFYPEVAAMPGLMALKARGGHVDLLPPDGAEIAQIVREPARAAQLHFEFDSAAGVGLDDLLCDAARGSPDTLPLLQYCLDELYRQRAPDGTLRLAVYAELGGIEGALGARAEQVVAGLGAAQIAALPQVLSQLVSVADGQFAVTARRAPWSALQTPAERELVRALVDARLFVSELRADVPSFGVAHEALLRRWPRAQAWIARHRHTLQVRTRIGQQAANWAAQGRPRDLLLPKGSQVNQARELLGMEGFTLNAAEQDYVRLSVQRVRLAERARVGLFALVTVLAVLACGLGLAARAAQQRAEQHRVDAEGLMGFMLGDFVDKLRPLGRLDLLDSVSARALAYLSGAKTDDGGEAALTQRAKTLQLIAEVDIARANGAAATTALQAARLILTRQVAAAPRDKGLLKDLGANAFWLGQVAFDRNAWDVAATEFGAYLAASDRLAALDPSDPDGWIEQSYARNSLGSVALRRGANAEAVQQFASSVALKRRALAAKPGDTALAADLADSLSWQATASGALGRLDAAQSLYEQERAQLLPLHAATPGDALWTHRLADAYWHLGQLLLVRGQAGEAAAALAPAVTLLGGAAALDPSNRQWQVDLAIMEVSLLDAQLVQGGADPQTIIARLLALNGKLAAQHALDPQRVELSQVLGRTEQRVGGVYLQLGQAAPARAHAERALALLKPLVAGAPAGSALLAASYAEALLLSADIAAAAGQDGAVQAACGEARAQLRPLIANSTDYKVLAPNVRAHLCSGDAAAVAGQQKQLEQMSYREVQYLRYLVSHPTKKGFP